MHLFLVLNKIICLWKNLRLYSRNINTSKNLLNCAANNFMFDIVQHSYTKQYPKMAQHQMKITENKIITDKNREAVNFWNKFSFFFFKYEKIENETVFFLRIGYDVYKLTYWRDVLSAFCMELLSMLQHHIFHLCSSVLDLLDL